MIPRLAAGRLVQPCIVSTAQHRDLLEQVQRVFDITPDHDLDLISAGQGLCSLTARALAAIERLLQAERPDVVVVQGDTTSAFAVGLAAAYRKVPVAHVEAGLRSGDRSSPFPEELNRRLTAVVAALHFAPSARARENLLREGVPFADIHVTGNTVVDALQHIVSTDAFRATPLPCRLAAGARLLVATLHRRESWGQPLAGMCRALRTVVDRHDDVELVFPVHPNPEVQRVVRRVLGGERGHLCPPLDYLSFLKLLSTASLVFTDSGGVQEEAPVLGTPVLVLRDRTERPEAIEAGVAQLVGTAPAGIVSAATRLLTDGRALPNMARIVSPFGDGRAAPRIVDVLYAFLTAARGEANA